MNLRFEEDLELWSRLDVQTVGCSSPSSPPWVSTQPSPWCIEPRAAVSSVAARGFTLSDPASWDADTAMLATAVDVAADVDAGCVFVTGGTPGPFGFDDCVVALDTALDLVRDRARDRGIRLAIEHTNPLRRDVGFVHTLRDMVEVARRLDVGVVVELTNCSVRARAGPGHRRRRRHVPARASERLPRRDAHRSERAVPGDGDMPLVALLSAITNTGYDGYVELEMLGPRIEAEGYGPAIAGAIQVLEPMLPSR